MKIVSVTPQLSCLILLLVSQSPASAALVTFNIRGQVTSVPTELASQFSVGDSIVGSFTFDSEAVLNGNTYLSSVSGFDVAINNSHLLAADGLGDILVENGTADRYSVAAFSTGGSINQFDPLLHAIQLADSSGQIFADNSLPLVPPDLTQFDQRLLTFDYESDNTTVRLEGHLDSWSAVPEPTSTSLLAACYLTMCVSRRRRTAVTRI